MSTQNLIIIIAVAIVVAIFIIFPEARKLISGFIHVFVKDQAKTPEGARAVYDRKIDEVQDAYNRSASVYKKLVGEVKQTENDIEALKKTVKASEMNAESAVRANRMEDAQLFAEEREDALANLETLNAKLKELIPMRDRAKTAYQENEKLLNRLRSEAKKVVRQIQTDEQLKLLYQELDENCRVSSTDKLLDSVREGAEDLRKETTGAAAVHDAKFSTRKASAEERARNQRSNDYLESLRAKYNTEKK